VLLTFGFRFSRWQWVAFYPTPSSKMSQQARKLLQLLAQRTRRNTLEFLWKGSGVAVPGTFSLVYANQLTTET